MFTKPILRASIVAAALLVVVAPASAGDDEIKERLKRPVSLDLEATPLCDALAFIRDRWGLAIEIDVAAFDKAGVKKVERSLVKIANQVNVPLDKILHKLLKEVKGTYRIKDGTIIVEPIVIE